MPLPSQQEMQCLQDKFDDISDDKCREKVKEFIQDEDEDIDLDAILMRACTPMIKKFCNVSLEFV